MLMMPLDSEIYTNCELVLSIWTEKSINIDYKIFNETLLKFILKFIPQQMLL